MGILDHITIQELYAGQEATVRTGHWTTDWIKIGKRVHQGCIISPCLFNFYAEYIMWNARLDEAGIKIAVRNINNLRYADVTTLMAESEEGLNSFLMKMKEESEKAVLKLNIKKKKKPQHSKNKYHDTESYQFMSNRWGKYGDSVRFHFLGFQNQCGWWP